MEHAAFGFMTRNDMKSGEIFEPSTVKQRMDLASATTICIPVILILKKECLYGVIWHLLLTMCVLDTAESMWRAICHQ